MPSHMILKQPDVKIIVFLYFAIIIYRRGTIKHNTDK